ncbi:MAG TPA: lipid-A-disaccharide synthase [Gemmatimonadaceae bacterium]|nr:lipid-A-disaccharide synthase [Gemmatimonadaceae bacterium]
MREILFVAGEPSGDANAAAVARALRAAGATQRFVGVGGDQLRAAGADLLKHIDRLAVMGFVGILSQIPRHWALLHDIEDRLRAGNVDLVILVDYGGFNLHVAAAAKGAGVPVLYFITPQVWASRPGRMRALAANVTKAAVIFRFEEELLRKNGIDAVFVGHPMLDRAANLPSPAEARAELGLSPDAKILALFPGSRRQEIERHLGPFVETARRLQAEDPSLQVIVSSAPGVELDAARCPFAMVKASSWSIFRAADAALCKSGTTTLEAAVAGCPLVVAYRASAVDFAIARQIATVTDIGMVNIIARRRIVPEFVQDELEPSRVAPVLRELLDARAERRQTMLRDLAQVRESLGERGAAGRVADLALRMIGEGAR